MAKRKPQSIIENKDWQLGASRARVQGIAASAMSYNTGNSICPVKDCDLPNEFVSVYFVFRCHVGQFAFSNERAIFAS